MNVKEFSKHVGINAHTIRYYEKIGLFNNVQRLENGHRCFSSKDIEWIKFVQRLKETGMPLSQIHRYAELRAEGDSTLAARRLMLEAHAKSLEESIARQRLHLEKLNEKIAFYTSAIDSKNTP